MEAILTGPSEVTIVGNIKTIEDYLDIKKVMKEMIGGGIDSISIKIPDSISITSALIGFLLRLVHEDRVKLTVYVKKDKLFNLFEVMNLVTIFNVKRI